MKAPTRLAVGATQIARRTMKNMSGMRMYCLNDTGELAVLMWWVGERCEEAREEVADSTSFFLEKLGMCAGRG